MKTLSIFFIFSLLLLNCISAQIPSDRDVLLNGEGNGQGMFAESHDYPGPKHILDLAKELGLSDEQKKSIQKIYDDMHTRAKDVGARIVEIEEELNDAFKTGLISDKSIMDDTEQIGKLRGKLRAIHLTAHLKTKKLLTTDQLVIYKKLRSTQLDQKQSGGEHKH
jgi:Spy/CpxP family protein refolding chaperone